MVIDDAHPCGLQLWVCKHPLADWSKTQTWAGWLANANDEAEITRLVVALGIPAAAWLKHALGPVKSDVRSPGL